MRPRPTRSVLFLALACISFAAWTPAQDRPSSEPVPDAVSLDAFVPLDRLAAELAAKRVVFVGEIHDRYDHHLNQLEIIRRLHELDPGLAIGVEYFQQPFQAQVDDYIAGRISEAEFLRATEYYQRWRFDYRLYAPIFRYAREQRIPVRALNVPTALTSAVARAGISGLAANQRAYLPRDIEPADDAYRARLREAFEEHRHSGPDGFNHFVEAQLVWDEGMAESAAAWLNANPGRRMVILAGAGHIAFASGIPKRLARRLPGDPTRFGLRGEWTGATYAIVLSSGEEIEPRMADYLLLSQKQDLPPAATLGVRLEDQSRHREGADKQTQGGEVRIASLVPDGPAGKAGLKKGDVIAALNGQPIKTTADVSLILWDKRPGDRVRLTVRHKRLLGATTDRDLEIALAAPPNPNVGP